MIGDSLDKYRDFGLLLLRASIGLYMALGHGWGKLTGGPERWAGLGGSLEQIFGIGFLPTFWGFMSMFAEFFCALLVVAGYQTRPALFFLLINMAVAATGHMSGAISGGPERALLYGLVFLSLLFIGPGKYSIDTQFGGRRTRNF